MNTEPTRELPPHLRILDAPQREAATAPRNCVVTAGAGAGKTMTLVARYLHLVVDKKIPVESILALTFTRKAAAEMSSRIYEALSAQDSAAVRAQFSRMEKANITTLDSFCAKIVRKSASDYGYTKDFAIDDKSCSDICADAARSFAIKNRDRAGMKALLEFYKLDEVAENFFARIGNAKTSPSAAAAASGPGLFSSTLPSISKLAKKLELEILEEIAEASAKILESAQETNKRNEDCAQAVETAKTFFSDGASAETIRKFLPLRFTKYARSDPPQMLIKDEARKIRDSLAPHYLEFLDFADFEPTYARILELLDEYSEIVREKKRKANVMDFKDLGSCAVDTLLRRKDIRRYWKERIRSIMIDEFQDDNELQKDLLYLLAEKTDREGDSVPKPEDLEDGKLFFVGDEKQSIYMFRNADVSVFRSLAAGLGAAGGGQTGGLQEGPAGRADYELSMNYRSTPRLIGFFNELFSRVMASSSEAYEARYSPMNPRPAASGLDYPASRVECRVVRKPDARAPESSEVLSADEAVALGIAEFIRSAHDEGNLLVRDGDFGLRPAGYGDFAILLRATTKQHILEKYLRLLEIPFESESPRSLFVESPAWDIFNILSLFLDPEDRNAYAAVLRGPLCRLSDPAFAERVLDSSPIFEPGKTFNGEDKASMSRMKAFYDHLSSIADKAGVSEIVKFIWYFSGIRFEILSQPELHPFLAHFDHLFRMACETDGEGGSVSDFVQKLKQWIGSTAYKETDKALGASVGRAKISTIHKAKGLQFPIVILPWIEYSGNRTPDNRIWRELPEGITVNLRFHERIGEKASNVFYSRAKSLRDKKEAAETKRLFYVACTRAMDHLLFWGIDSSDGKTEAASEDSLETPASSDSGANSFLGLLMGGDEAGGLGGWLKIFREEPRPLPSVPWKKLPKVSDMGRTLASYAERAAKQPVFPYPGTSASALSQAAQEAMGTGPGPCRRVDCRREAFSSQAHNSGLAARHLSPEIFGTLCHAIAEYGMANAGFEAFLPDLAALGNPSEADLEKDLETAGRLAKSFLESRFWEDLKNRFGFRTEVPFIWGVGPSTVEGRVDVLLENQEEAIILDLKTDAEECPERYILQLEIYRRAFEAIISTKPVRAALVWLSTGGVHWCSCDLLESAIEPLAQNVLLSGDQNSGTKSWYPDE